tara:strand:+ start:268 stop:411 length:144 start_codon:yes stop_codon:yes gene_type:complete
MKELAEYFFTVRNNKPKELEKLMDSKIEEIKNKYPNDSDLGMVLRST